MPTVVRGEIAAPDDHLLDVARVITAGYLAGYGNDATRRNYAASLAQWGAWLSENRVAPLDVKRAHLELWMRHLEERGLKPATVALRLTAVCGWYRYAFDEEFIDRDPSARVRLPKVSTESPVVALDRTECLDLATAAKKHHPRSHALVAVLLSLGLRISEALSIDIEDFGEDGGHRTLSFIGKGGKPALVPVPPQLGRVLDRYIGDRTSGPLFLTVKPPIQRLSRYAAAQVLADLGIKAGIAKHVHPHALRHASITGGLDANTNLREMVVFARHADAKTTTRYDRTRFNLDRHPAYTVARWFAVG